MMRCSGSKLWFSGAWFLLICGCGAGAELEEGKRPTVPASMAGMLSLSKAQQDALGVVAEDVKRLEIAEELSTTGWLETEPGREVVVKAPTAGFVEAEPTGQIPKLSQSVKKGERLLSLRVFLSPQEVAQLVSAKEDVDISLEQSLVSMKLAEKQLELAAQAEGAVLGTRLNDLKEIYAKSRAAYEQSRDKLPFLAAEPYNELALVKPVAVQAPLAGMISHVHVSQDQFVLQGDPLWTLTDWSRLWLRVPVFEADLHRVISDGEARVAPPNSKVSLGGRRVNTLLPTREGLRTIDLIYEVDNTDGTLRAGQSVAVGLPTSAKAMRMVVPKSAVLWDGLGNAWVYVRLSPQSFRRQKVELGAIIPQGMIVTRGLGESDQIVTTGAASLYGQEFKGDLPAGDDD